MGKPYPPVKPQDMEIIEAYLDHLRRRQRTAKTIDDRREILYRLNRDLEWGIGNVSVDELRAWLHRPGLSQNSRATYYRAIKSFYTWATDPDDPWLTENPARTLEKVTNARGLPRPCTDDELKRVLTEAIEPFRTWAILAAYQGLRCIEISRLDREHVTREQLIVVCGKGNRPRVHDTDEYVWAAIRDLPPGPVARHRVTGERATDRYVSIHASHYFHRKLGLDLSLHRMRHWLGVNTQKRYKNIRVTQKVLGHVSLAATQVYTDADAEEQRAARAMLPRLAG